MAVRGNFPALEKSVQEDPLAGFAEGSEDIRCGSSLSVPSVTDYETLCAPHVASVQAVLKGRQCRYKMRFENAVLIFDHGCLMGRVWLDGRCYALPPLLLTPKGDPYFQAVSSAQQFVWTEFCQLPKGILLFYFTLLKQATGGGPLSLRGRNFGGGETRLPMPKVMQAWLRAVDWPFVAF